ncbi:uncharacterized protein LOC131888157 [Tigriopus californicus]|uniref:uncharacterized protein LOC131888157 n=1 Tax=Tigriopus californicus TaxID=6832 RepID=UPI0027DA83AD|nr:uncharacterized protein LOC131888157 [Tigriopus californicus]
MPSAMTSRNPPRDFRRQATKIEFHVQATKAQFDTLFRVKDEVHAVLEELLNNELDEDMVFGIALQFLSSFWNSPTGRLEAAKCKLHPEDTPKISKAFLDPNVLEYIFPIEIVLKTREEVKAQILTDIENLQAHLADKYSPFNFEVDTFVVLMEAFRFMMSHRMQLGRHFLRKNDRNYDDDDEEEEEEEVKQSWINVVPCDVCQDDSYSQYCGSHVCAKCKKFFKEIMRSRESLSLRCYKNQRCLDNFDCVDIKCGKCRFQVCESLGMVSEYYFTEIQITNVINCASCSRESDSLVDIFGVSVCQTCRDFFYQSLENFSFLHYDCPKERNCTLTRDSNAPPCATCLFDKIKALGMVDLYFWKTQHDLDESVDDYEPVHDVVYRDESKCCVCNGKASPSYWLGLKCCEVCKGFVAASMTNRASDAYCCRKGERGFLCPTLESGKTCSYCWLRRLEIEGIIDRWNICGGQPSAWAKNFLNCDEILTDDSSEGS